jgi:hypothetical protein
MRTLRNEPEWRRVDGDEVAAAKLKAIEDLLKECEESLVAGSPVQAMGELVRARMIFNEAIVDIERLTRIPFGALMIDSEFGR